MRPLLLFFVLVALMVSGAQSQQSPVALSGVVVEAGTDKPLSRVSLELQPFASSLPPGMAPPPPSAPVTDPRYPGITNDSGQFIFRNIPPGRYRLIASRNGFVHAEYGQRGPNGKALPLVVAAGQPLSGIQLSMTRAAAISGHVLDSKGEPYPYMQMHARRVSYPDGVRTLTNVGSTYTDDLGEYRIYGLPPGQYVLVADGETSGQGILPVAASLAPPLPGSVVIQGIGGSMLYSPDPANQRKPAQRLTSSSAVYFRNAIRDRDAWLIQLRPGDDLKGTDIVFTGIPKVPVAFSGSGIGLVLMTITPGPTTIRGSFAQQNAQLRTTLAPGSYVAAGVGGDVSGKPMAGYISFDVTPSSSPNLSIAFTPPIPVTGRIVLEGGPIADGELAKVGIVLRPNPPIPGISDSGIRWSAPGSFTSSRLVNADYAVKITLPESLRDRYVKSGNILRASGAPVNDFEIVLGARAGQIEGAATSETGMPLSNVTVVLVPEQRDRTDLYRSLFTDAAGSFRFEGIAPGRYLLFSWEDVDSDAWFNPEFIRALEDRGKPVVIAEGSRERLDVAAIPMR